MKQKWNKTPAKNEIEWNIPSNKEWNKPYKEWNGNEINPPQRMKCEWNIPPTKNETGMK